MENLSILIVEDQLSFQLELEMLITRIGYEVLQTVDNAADALQVIEGRNPDLILMDIHLKGETDGIELAHSIQHLEIPVLYITSSGTEEMYQRAAGPYNIGYLVKPIDKITLQSSIELAIRSLVQKKRAQQTSQDTFHLKDCFFLKKKGLLHKVPLTDILYLKADGDYCHIFTLGEKFTLNSPMGKVLKNLPDDFLRIHRTYAIYLKAIEQVSPGENQVRVGGEVLPLGRAYKQNLMQRLKTLD